MSILVLSHDEEAAQLLCAAIARKGSNAHWEHMLDAARAVAQEKTPLVVVADTAVAGHERLIEDVNRRNPWTRVYLMVDPAAKAPYARIPAIAKPFDAAEFAEQLTREQRLAELECEQRSLQRELEHAERLAAVGRIAAGMAHEINNPLAVITACAGYVADLATRTRDTELSECAQDTLLAAERIGSFVQHVCGYARRDVPELSDRPVQAALYMALRLVRPRMNERKVVAAFEASPEPRVPHDPPRLAQAVLNLLSNAVDAAAEGGGHVMLRVALKNGEVVIQVDDDGPGIASEIRDRIFEPFATTKPVGQGTGLGLSITRQIVSDHGGRISLVRREQGGTRAEIALRPLDTASYRVLVLNEHAHTRLALETAVRHEGFEVDGGGTLADAREVFAARSVAVIVTGGSLPDAAPGELIAALREASAASRVLVVTAAVRGISSADLVLKEPWNRDELIGAVRQLSLQFERR